MQTIYRLFFPVALLGCAAVSDREPQRISVTYEAYIPEGWVASDQFGTHGMGDTKEEAIADCKRTYQAKLKRLGIKVPQTETGQINGKWLREIGFKYHPIRKYYYRSTINDILLVYASGSEQADATQWYLCAVADHIDPAEYSSIAAMLTGRATREDVLQVVEIAERERQVMD